MGDFVSAPSRLRPVSAIRKRAAITVLWVETIVNVSSEVFAAMKPRPRADKNAAAEPLWTIVAVWRAVVRRHVIVAVRTYWRRAYFYGDLRLARRNGERETDYRNTC
jgi:hypothetical protein